MWKAALVETLQRKINRLRNWQVALIIAVFGFAAFSTSLTNSFQGDDNNQILNSVPVHSLAHVNLLFEGGTFYNGHGLTPLTGAYYRPLMTTVFALIYSVFGSHSFYFHFVQLLIYLGAVFTLFLFLKYSFGVMLSLALALVFLLHPLNSQVAFAIPSMQDALFFFFGVLSLWSLIRFKSVRSLALAALLLFLSLLSKESGSLFVLMALLYLSWFDRKRLLPFVGIVTPVLVAYLLLKVNAVGLARHTQLGPIDNLGFGGRLMTMPSIILFYIVKFVFPWKLASAYYWVYPRFSFQHVLLPLVIDLVVIALFVYMGYLVRERSSKAQYVTYRFFGIWAGAGLIIYSQIFPLDMTACETWFYFSMAGVLGMIGVVLLTFQARVKPGWFVLVLLFLLMSFGIRTAVRGTDWKNEHTLALHDILASKEDYNAFNNISLYLNNHGNYALAEVYAQRSIAIYPTYTNYSNLGTSLTNLGNYSGAVQAYDNGLRYGQLKLLYDDLADLTVVQGDPSTNKAFLSRSLEKFPNDPMLWLSYAILEQRYYSNKEAKAAVSYAAHYGQVPQGIYDGIMDNQPFSVSVGQEIVSVPATSRS